MYNIILTGGSRGIGNEVMRTLLLSENVRVFYSYINEQDFSLSNHPGVISYQSDCSTFEGCEKFVNFILNHTDKVDCLINNLGVAKFDLLNNTSLETWNKILSTNVNSALFMYKLLVDTLEQSQGKIININSIVHKKPVKGSGVYSVSKAALSSLTRQMVIECTDRKISVIEIVPGFILTDALKKDIYSKIREKNLNEIPLNRFGSPADVANNFRFLLSNNSFSHSGISLDVTGGQHII